jgi:hypothetical protein
MLVVAAALVSAAAVAPALAYDPQGKPADNSGRRLAVVIPGMPHPGVPLAVAPHAHRGTTGIKSAASTASGDDGFSENPTLAGFGTQLRLSRQTQETLENGLKASRVISDAAWKRLTDMATWISILLRQSEQAPRVSPGNGLVVMPEVNVAAMTPIGDPGKSTQLVLTSERRLRTVVGR